MNKPTQEKLDRQWKIKNALDTLTRAEEIKRDRGLMSGVRKQAKIQEQIIKKVRGKK